jgi:hypothetical protein
METWGSAPNPVLAGRQPVISDRKTIGYYAGQMSRVSGFAFDERASLALDIRPTFDHFNWKFFKFCFQKILYEE